MNKNTTGKRCGCAVARWLRCIRLIKAVLPDIVSGFLRVALAARFPVPLGYRSMLFNRGEASCISSGGFTAEDGRWKWQRVSMNKEVIEVPTYADYDGLRMRSAGLVPALATETEAGTPC
jgi:hypothetical protein